MSPEITQQMFDEGHYLPANNAFAFHICDGPEGEKIRARLEVVEIYGHCREQGMSNELAKRFCDWYLSSINKCFDAYAAGNAPERLDSLYERFVL